MTAPIDPKDGRLADLSPEEKRALLARLLKNKAGQSKTEYPLSYNQQSMWFMHQLAPDSAAYNVALQFRIRSAVDLPVLKRALQTLVDRHASLRTDLAMQDRNPIQTVHAYREMSFEQIDAAAWDEDELYAQVDAAYRRPFDLEHGPLHRFQLFTRSGEDHVLLISAHHIVFDGWSAWILMDELHKLLVAGKAGVPAQLPPTAAQYTDFARWQIETLAGPEGERLWDYWRAQLGGDLPVIELPVDRPRPPFQTFNGAAFEFVLDAELTERIKQLARATQATLYGVLLAAFQVLLHRYSGQPEIVIGSPVVGRPRAEFAATIGDFVNMVVLRGDLSGDPAFTRFLEATRAQSQAAIDHQDFPLALLVDRLKPRNDPSRSPLFQVMFDLQRLHRFSELAPLFMPQNGGARIDMGGLLVEQYPLPQQQGQMDLTLQMLEAGPVLGGGFKYNVDLFDAETIRRMMGHWETLLRGIVADPSRRLSELPLLTASERTQLLVTWNATQTGTGAEQTISDLVQEQVERNPGAAAVIAGDASLKYGELNRRANRLAHRLQALGVVPDTLVGVCVDRSVDMAVAVLGVLKAGGAYVPLDPALPRERLGLMIADTGMPVIVTQAPLLADLPAGSAQIVALDRDAAAIASLSDANPPTTATAGSLAYTIYTSGSTGKPKGVQITHGAVVNFLRSMAAQPGLAAEDVLLAVTTLSFDIAGLELWLPLITGARVVIASRDEAADGPALARLIADSGATVMQATPVTWRMLLDAGWQGDRGLRVLCGGEALPPDLAGALLEGCAEVWNLYGPTETTIWSTLDKIERDAPITVGRPIANTVALVLDAHGQPVPAGVPGELYLGGAGVARGYLKRPDLTAERFLPNPWMTAETAFAPVIYRTGDLARFRGDGRIEHLGRLDFQVKLRGFRIELGEIEAVLREHPAVEQAVVTLREDRPGDKRLVAYVVPRPGATVAAGELRAHAHDHLPEYMIPSAFVPLEQLPLTSSRKVDRRALPAPEPAAPVTVDSADAPHSAMEQLVAGVWQQELGIETVSVYDNFFDLGGHSLASVRVLTALEKQTGVKLSPALIRLQTLGQLAATFEEQLRNPAPAPVEPKAGWSGQLKSAIRRAVSRPVRGAD